MNKRGKQVLLFSLFVVLAFVIISVFAIYLINAGRAPAQAVLSSPVPPSIQAKNSTNNETNFTFTVSNNNASDNITNVLVTFPNGFEIITNLNGTDAESAVLQRSAANHSLQDSLTLNWSIANGTATNGISLITSAAPRNFWVYVNASLPSGTYGINVSIYDNSSNVNSTNISITVQDNTSPLVESINTTRYLGYQTLNINNFSTFNTTSTVNFSCNASDNVALLRIDLWMLEVISGGPFTPQSRLVNSSNVSGTYNQTNFTQTIQMPGTYTWYCQVRDTSNNINYSSINNTVTVNAFSISGWVKNSTYDNVSGANVSMYEFIMGQQGPPTERFLRSVLTSANGQFNLTDIQNNGSGGQQMTIYKLKVFLNNSAGLVTEIGPSLPPLPREPLVFNMQGGTIYLQNATTLRLFANNNITLNGTGAPPYITNDTRAMRFGYIIMDQSLGFPIESNIQGDTATADVIVPSNRNYTVIFLRDPFNFNMTGTPAICAGPGYMNASDCPSPPMSISITSNNILSYQNSSEVNSTPHLVTINKSLAFGSYNLTGCVNILGNTTPVDVKDIIAKMIPWEGFVPPMKGEVSDFDGDDTSSFILGRSGSGLNGARGCTLGAFNLTLMGAAGGISWLIEAYAENSSALGAEGEYSAIFQNITMSNSAQIFNLTLVRLLGKYSMGGVVNTSKIEVAIMDSNGTAPQDAHVEVIVKNNNVFGTMHYIIESLTNGKFNMSILNNTQEVKVRVFGSQFAPKEQKINLGANRTNITLYSFRPMMILENGSFSDSKMTGSRMEMKFMRYSTACNVYLPAATCQIGDSKTADFDPMQAMMAGKSNLRMKTTNNITLYFINVDLIASGPPDAVMNDNASSASSSSSALAQVWKFGSLAPNIYDYVIIGIPYNTTINENWSYYVNLSFLYDNDNNVIWNATANGTGTSQIPSDYSDFNSSWFSTPGMICGNTTAAATPTIQSCYMNVTNDNATGHAGYFWLTIPHFSTTANKISGSATTTTTTTTSTTTPSAGGGGTTTTVIYDVSENELTSASKEIGISESIKFKIENETHTLKLLGLTASSASVQIRSVVLTKLLQVGKEELVDIDADGINEISLMLNSINLNTMKANITVKSLVYVAPAVETPAGNQSEPATTPPEGAAETPTAAVEKPRISKAVLWAGIITVIVIVIILAVLARQLKKK